MDSEYVVKNGYKENGKTRDNINYYLDKRVFSVRVITYRGKINTIIGARKD